MRALLFADALRCRDQVLRRRRFFQGTRRAMSRLGIRRRTNLLRPDASPAQVSKVETVLRSRPCRSIPKGNRPRPRVRNAGRRRLTSHPKAIYSLHMNAQEQVNRIVGGLRSAPIVPVPAKLPDHICPHCSGAGRDMDRPGAPICSMCKGWGAIPRLQTETALTE